MQSQQKRRSNQLPDDLHPYYKRKAEKNAEMIDLLVVVTKWFVPLLFVAWLVDKFL